MLQWKREEPALPHNETPALNQYQSQKKCQKKQDFALLYPKQIHENISLGYAPQLISNKIKTSHGITNYMPYHSVANINKPKWINTCSNSTIKTLNQHPRILSWCLILLTLLYFFSGTIFVRVQQELSDAIEWLYQHTTRYELNQKHVQLKFNLPSSQWMGLCMKIMVKFTKRLKEIVQIMYLH